MKHRIIRDLEEGLKHMERTFHRPEYLWKYKEVCDVIESAGFARSTAERRIYSIMRPTLPVSRSWVEEWLRIRKKNTIKNRAKSLPHHTYVTQRMKEGIALHRAGLGYKRIGRRLEIGAPAAYRLVQRGLKRESEAVAKRRTHQNGNPQMQTQTHIPGTP